ncbi:MAG: hypothetical protein ACLQVI_02760 [Polyangiaceae bacterium]
MPRPSIVPFMRMHNRRFSLTLFALSVALVAGCGQIVPLEEQQACPCAAGYTCCDAVCVVGACPTDTASDGAAPPVCEGTLALGTQSVPGDPDASALPSVQTVTGRSQGTLTRGTPVPFSYATSVWPTPYGWQLDGWVFSAAAGESLTFQVWADEDAGTVPLSLVIYGPLLPLEGADAGSCGGALQGAGAMAGTEISWAAPGQGAYFAAPFHQVIETSSGLAFQGLNDTSYAHAFIVVSPAAE